MSDAIKVLLVDDQEDNLVEYELILKQLTEYEVQSVNSSLRAIELCQKEPFDVLVTDVRMPGKNGDEMFAEIKKAQPNIRCVVITGFPSQDAPVNFLKLGAHDYLLKAGFGPETFVRSVNNQVQIVQLRKRTEDLQRQLEAFHRAIQEIMGTVQSVAQLSRAPELVQSLRDFTEMATLVCDAPVGALFLPEEGSGRLALRCAVGAGSESPPIPLGQGFAGRTAQSGRVRAFVRTPDGTWPGDEVPSSIEAGRQSALSVPLVVQNACVGVLEVFDKERFEQRDIELLSRLGAIGATCLDLFNATELADNLLLRALKLATDAEQSGSPEAVETAKQALVNMSETIHGIDLVGSGERASEIVEQIRQISEFGPQAENCAQSLLASLLAMLRAQHAELPEIIT